MKKILLALAFVATAFTSTAQAHGYGYNRGAYFASGVVIGAATYAIATQPRVIYGPPAYYGPYYPGYPYSAPVVVQQPVYIQQSYPSNEYRQETILDANCNCYRQVWVRN